MNVHQAVKVNLGPVVGIVVDGSATWGIHTFTTSDESVVEHRLEAGGHICFGENFSDAGVHINHDGKRLEHVYASATDGISPEAFQATCIVHTHGAGNPTMDVMDVSIGVVTGVGNEWSEGSYLINVAGDRSTLIIQLN